MVFGSEFHKVILVYLLTIADDEMTAHIGSVITGLPVSDTRLQRIVEAQEEDPVCRQIKTYCSEGWPDKHSVNDAMKAYWSSRGELTEHSAKRNQNRYPIVHVIRDPGQDT